MTKEQAKKLVEELLPLVVTNDKRGKNKGRPRIGMPKSEVELIRAFRQKNASLQGIFRVMRMKDLTKYKTYQAFSQAWVRHKANS